MQRTKSNNHTFTVEETSGGGAKNTQEPRIDEKGQWKERIKMEIQYFRPSKASHRYPAIWPTISHGAFFSRAQASHKNVVQYRDSHCQYDKSLNF